MQYLVIFGLMAVESSFIPFPSEVVMIPAGYFAARGQLSAWAAVVVGVMGSILGAFVNYYLALFVGRPFLEKYGKYLFINKDALAKSCDLFNKYGEATTFICRLIPAIRQLISIPAGIAKMNLLSFTFFTALGAGIWSTLLCVVGYGLGAAAGDMTNAELVAKGKVIVMHHLPWCILGAVVLVILYALIHKALKRFLQSR